MERRLVLVVAVVFVVLIMGGAIVAVTVFAVGMQARRTPTAAVVAQPAAETSLPTAEPAQPTPLPTPSAVATLPALEKAAPAPGRTSPGGTSLSAGLLLILGDDGNLYTSRPNGAGLRQLTNDAGVERLYQQATWSPTGDRVAWSEMTQIGEQITSTLRTVGLDGATATAVTTDMPPFYFFWSPDGDRLAFLANGSNGVDLALVDLQAGGDRLLPLAQGAPLYFSWAPHGQRLLTHVGLDYLGLLDLDGTHTELPALAAAFAAPRWAPDGEHLVYAEMVGSEQHLVVADLEGKAQRSLATFKGNLSFVLSPDGSAVAYVDTTVQAPTAAFGRLFVAPLDGSEAQTVSEGPVLAFFWSPDSRYLLYLAFEDAPAPDSATLAAYRPRQDGPPPFVWHVWDGTRDLAFGRFLPSNTLMSDYLRFFDQYAQSMTLWAPDGSAFVYAGIGSDDEDGIWVQSLAAASLPRRVAPGEMATWSPK